MTAEAAALPGAADRPATADRPEAHERGTALRVIQEHLGLPRLRRLQRTDNVTNVAFVAADWLVIAGAVAASIRLDSALALAAAVATIGSRQRALMALLHQASHGQLFADRVANRWCGRLLIAFPLAMSLDAYRRTHLAHHRHLWDEARDPKTIRYAALGLVRAPRRVSRFAVRHLLGALALLHVPFNVGTAVMTSGAPRRERIALLAFWGVVVAVALLTGAGRYLLWYWALPYATSFHDAVNYLVSDAELEAALGGFRRNLAPGGVVVFDANALSTYRGFFASLSVLPAEDLVLVWRGEASAQAQPGAFARATVEALVRGDDGAWSGETHTHLQRHHPEPVVRGAAGAAGLRVAGLRGMTPDGAIHDGFSEAEHSKALYVLAAAER